MCGSHRGEAMRRLQWLERSTRPNPPPTPIALR
jgi:hypothetical protein